MTSTLKRKNNEEKSEMIEFEKWERGIDLPPNVLCLKKIVLCSKSQYWTSMVVVKFYNQQMILRIYLHENTIEGFPGSSEFYSFQSSKKFEEKNPYSYKEGMKTISECLFRNQYLRSNNCYGYNRGGPLYPKKLTIENITRESLEADIKELFNTQMHPPSAEEELEYLQK
jgi:hypothetical protein